MLLQLIGLLGGWTVTSNIPSGPWDESEFDISSAMAEAYKKSSSVLFSFVPSVDLKNTTNIVLQVTKAMFCCVLNCNS